MDPGFALLTGDFVVFEVDSLLSANFRNTKKEKRLHELFVSTVQQLTSGPNGAGNPSISSNGQKVAVVRT